MKAFLVFLLIIPPILAACSVNRFFPKGAFNTGNKVQDDMEDGYVTNLLITLDEPSLWKKSKADNKIESYRLLIDSHFHNIECVRIDLDYDGKIAIYEKIATHDTEDEKGIEIKGELLTSKTKELSKKEVYHFINQLDEIKLFEMYPQDFPKYEYEVTSGSETYLEIPTDLPIFIFEHLKGSKYKVIPMPVPNNGPINTDKLYQIAQLFFDLAEEKNGAQ